MASFGCGSFYTEDMSAERDGHHGPVIGIDLGTTNSLVAICDERGPRVIADADGSRLMPSVVRFGEDEQLVVGEEARREAITHASRTVSSAKRLFGRSLEELAAAERRASFQLVAGPRGVCAIDLGDRVVTPQEVAAHILGALRQRARRHWGVRSNVRWSLCQPTSTTPSGRRRVMLDDWLV